MKRGTPDHPKVYDFAERLGVGRPTAIGYLELLFHFTAQYAPEGNIGKYSDKRIAAGLDWHGSPSRMVEALVGAGWVDRSEGPRRVADGSEVVDRLVVHDWGDHIDRGTRQRLSANGLKPVESNHKLNGNLCTKNDSTLNQECSEPLHQPSTTTKPTTMPEPSTANASALVPADSSYREFMSACAERGIFQVGDTAWRRAAGAWKKLDFEQKLAAIRDIRSRDPDSVELRNPALPYNYLADHKWERPHVTSNGNRGDVQRKLESSATVIAAQLAFGRKP